MEHESGRRACKKPSPTDCMSAPSGTRVCRKKDLTLASLLGVENAVTRLLSTTKRVRNRHAGQFRKEVGKYVDSNNVQDKASSWALVKLCRIRGPWPVSLHSLSGIT